MRRITARQLDLNLEYDSSGTVWRIELTDEDGAIIASARDQVRGLTLGEAFEAIRYDLANHLGINEPV
jgi:hypothetical protein